MTGLVRTESHLYYWGDLGPFPGVTTVQGVMDKPALAGWYKKQVAECAMRNADMIVEALASGDDLRVDETRRFLSRFPDYVRDTAADLGTSVHHHAEQIALGLDAEVPEDARPFIAQYLAWRDEWRPEYLAVEYQGVNLTHRYGGTGDLIVRAHGETWLLDIKSGSYFDETALQLVACSAFDFIGFPDDPIEHALPEVDRFGVLDLKPDGWKVVEYVMDREATFSAFAHLAAVWHWKQQFKNVRREFASGHAAVEDAA